MSVYSVPSKGYILVEPLLFLENKSRTQRKRHVRNGMIWPITRLKVRYLNYDMPLANALQCIFYFVPMIILVILQSYDAVVKRGCIYGLQYHK